MHRHTTGPEIWEATGGRITHLVATTGTGGTISGAGEYLREVSGGRVTVVGADPETSAYGGGDGSPFAIEAARQYHHPETLDRSYPAVFRLPVVLAGRSDRFPPAAGEVLALLWPRRRGGARGAERAAGRAGHSRHAARRDLNGRPDRPCRDVRPPASDVTTNPS